MLTIENYKKLKGCKVGANGMVWKILRTNQMDFNFKFDK